MNATGGSNLEAQILADLRRTHAQLKASPGPQNLNVAAWSMRLTLEEVDVLLAAVDERDELRRQTVGDWETGFDPVRVDVVGYVADRLIPDGVTPDPRSLGRFLAEQALLTDCPRFGTHHDCPLGGCPTFESNRETEILDVPLVDRRHVNARCSVAPILDDDPDAEVVAALVRAGARAAERDASKPEIDGEGACESCRGSGMVAVGPWGSRPPRKTCPQCKGTGWSPTPDTTA